MSPPETFAGGCRCGAVRYEAKGEPLNVRLCHCRNCQKITGSAFFARAMFPAGAVSVTGPVTSFLSSGDLHRLFCPDCGSTLGARRDSRGVMSVTLGTLDDPDALSPTAHIFITRKVDWLKLDDGLPQYPEWAPQ
jgi:hypothetical protein